MGPPTWFANLIVNASESRNRWSGFRNGCAAEGFGRAEYAGDAFGSVGLWDGAFRMFFGSSDNGGEFSTSVYRKCKCLSTLAEHMGMYASQRTHDTSPSRNRWKTCSFDKIGWRATRFRKVCSSLFLRAMRMASSLALACLTA